MHAPFSLTPVESVHQVSGLLRPIFPCIDIAFRLTHGVGFHD
jgi:hypothetical protein